MDGQIDGRIDGRDLLDLRFDRPFHRSIIATRVGMWTVHIIHIYR
jgi:hypothetical protein